MSTLLIKNARLLATFDDDRREIPDGAVLIRDNVIESVGTSVELQAAATNPNLVLDLRDHLVLPGLVNTHHHMFQTLTRAVPAAQNAELFGWLRTLYPLWSRLTPEMIRVSTQTAMAEMLLSGCTTSSDHLYIYPGACRLDDSLEAATVIGMRFHACRGSLSLGESKGGLPPDRVVEQEPAILKDTARLIETYHDPARYAMQRIAVAPCSPFSVSMDLMRESAALARHYGVCLHTHLAENTKDVAYSREHFNMTPAEYAESVGWVGEDVWHAHCVQLDSPGIERFARTGTGVAHCPCANMRLASGIAPIRKMLDAGIKVAIGVDGAASNDGGHVLAEARQAMLLQRVAHGPTALTARQALEIATRGGAAVLGRNDVGQLAPGMAADLAAFDLNRIEFSGAWHDPLAALVFCSPGRASYVLVNGRLVVDQGQMTTLDLDAVVHRHNRLATELARGEIASGGSD